MSIILEISFLRVSISSVEDVWCELSINDSSIVLGCGGKPMSLPLDSLNGTALLLLKSSSALLGSSTVPVESWLENSAIQVEFSSDPEIYGEFDVKEKKCPACSKCGVISDSIDIIRAELEGKYLNVSKESTEDYLKMLSVLVDEMESKRENFDNENENYRGLIAEYTKNRKELENQKKKSSEQVNSYIKYLNGKIKELKDQSFLLSEELGEAKEKNNTLIAQVDALRNRQNTHKEQKTNEFLFTSSNESNQSELALYKEEFDRNLQSFAKVIEKLESENAGLIEENSILKTNQVQPPETIDLTDLYTQVENSRSKNSSLAVELNSMNEELARFSSENIELTKEITIMQDRSLELNSVLETSSKEKDELSNQQEMIELNHKNEIDILKFKLSIVQTDHLKAQSSAMQSSNNADSLQTYYENILSQFSQEITRQESKVQEKQISHTELLSQLATEKAELEEEAARLEEEARERSITIGNLQTEISKPINHVTMKDIHVKHLELENSHHKNQALIDQLKSMSTLCSLQSHKHSLNSEKDQAILEEIQCRNSEISKLKHSLDNYKSARAKYTPKANDPIDLALAEFVNNRDEALDIEFLRTDPGAYIYGTKKVGLTFEDGNILVQVGNGCMRIEEFLQLFTHEEIEKIKNRRPKKAIEKRAKTEILQKRKNSIPSKK